MSHINAKNAYKSLEERMNRFPQGAPPSETLYKILGILFSENEAALVAQLPIRPFTAKTAGRVWKTDEAAARNILDRLAARAILIDAGEGNRRTYSLPPPMAGFIEFSMMRTRSDVDQKLLSELYHQYLNVEEDFIKDLFFSAEIRPGRAFVQEAVLSRENLTQTLDFEKASHIIESARHIGISMCYCRHKARHLGTACDAPMDICMTFGDCADSLIRHEFARRVNASECMELLREAYKNNLVQFGENVRESPSFICNCCGCCCEALQAARKFGMLHPVQTTAYIPRIIEYGCTGCGQCAKACPIEAIELVAAVPSIPETNAGEMPPNTATRKKKARINDEICLGCGVCARACNNQSICMERRAEKIITPVNSVHRIVLAAIDQGKLADLVFDNRALYSHRAMAAVLSAILRLPPVKQAMAGKQMKSVYLDRLISRFSRTAAKV